MAQPVYPNFNMVGPVAHRAEQLRPHLLQGHRFQALDFSANLALKVGVRGMVLAGQFKMAHPAFQGDPAHHTPPAEVLQNAVNRDFVHPAAGAYSL
jgi:tryptophanase